MLPFCNSKDSLDMQVSPLCPPTSLLLFLIICEVSRLDARIACNIFMHT